MTTQTNFIDTIINVLFLKGFNSDVQNNPVTTDEALDKVSSTFWSYAEKAGCTDIESFKGLL